MTPRRAKVTTGVAAPATTMHFGLAAEMRALVGEGQLVRHVEQLLGTVFEVHRPAIGDGSGLKVPLDVGGQQLDTCQVP